MNQIKRPDKDKPRVYISGKILGDKHYRRKFRKAERKLKKRGYAVVNPARVSDALPSEFLRDEYMTIDLAAVGICDTIYMLPDWSDSKGAVIEWRKAVKEGKTIIYEQENMTNG